MRFTIYIAPRAKERPRLNRFTKQIYTPKNTTAFQDEIRKAICLQLGEDYPYPMFKKGEPVYAAIDLVFKRPKRLLRKKDPEGLLWKETIPDRDNLDKAILDALKGVLWHDDGQAVDGSVRTFYVEKDERPRICLHVRPAGDPPQVTCDFWNAALLDKRAGRKIGDEDE